MPLGTDGAMEPPCHRSEPKGPDRGLRGRGLRPMTKKPKSDYAIQAVANALRLLHVFRDDEDEIGVAELARRLGLPKNNVFRLLATMEEQRLHRAVPSVGALPPRARMLRDSARRTSARTRCSSARGRCSISCSRRPARRFTSPCAMASRSCTSRRALRCVRSRSVCARGVVPQCTAPRSARCCSDVRPSACGASTTSRS